MQLLGSILHFALLWRLGRSSFPKVLLHPSAADSSAESLNGGSFTHKHSKESPKQPLLQLMSMRLDSWGLMHAHDKPATEKADAAQIRMLQKPGPLLSLLSLDLENWGSKVAVNTSTHLPLDVVFTQTAVHASNPLAQVLASESNLFDSRGFHPQPMSFFSVSAPGDSMRNLGVIILSLLGLGMLFLCFNDGSTFDEDDPLQHSLSKDDHAAESGFATVEYSDGSWAQVYREARDEQKEALELLFRCNIISTDEFAFSSVSQEHIQECIWIATHMLRQKPLEEWVALWQQAQQTFEDSVTACFEARGGPHSNSNLAGNFPPMAVSSLSLGAVPLSSRGNRWNYQGDDEEDPYTTRSHYTPGSPGMQDTSQHLSLPTTQDSHLTQESGETHWSIESELDNGLAAHGLK